MLLKELNSEFEILFEDLATNGSKGLDMYEKSVCFTHAQENAVKSLATSNTLDPIQSIIKADIVSAFGASVYKTGATSPRRADMLYVLNYFATSPEEDIPARIVPTAVIDAMILRAYKYPPIDLVYVMVGENTNVVFPPLNFTMDSFSTRYVEYPSPIILEDLTGTDTINGITVATPPILEESFHRALVFEAVKFAISIYVGQQEKEATDGTKGD